MNPALSSLADRLEAAGRAAKQRGEVESALAMFEAVLTLRAVVEPEAAERLTVQHRKPKMSGVEHTTATRQRISKALGGDSPNMKAARAAGVPSLRQLAARLGCTVSFLSQVVKGDRPMPPLKAEAFKALTGKAWQ